MSDKRKYRRQYLECDKIAGPIEKEFGRYNLTQIKVGIKAALMKAALTDDPLVNFDMMASDIVIRWDEKTRHAAEKAAERDDGVFPYMPELKIAFGDGTRVPLKNLSRPEFYEWDRMQDKALEVVVAKHGIRKTYIDSRKEAWQAHHETIGDVEAQVFGYVEPEPEPVVEPEPEPV
jgi:hypothetical protein